VDGEVGSENLLPNPVELAPVFSFCGIRTWELELLFMTVGSSLIVVIPYCGQILEEYEYLRGISPRCFYFSFSFLSVYVLPIVAFFSLVHV